MRCTMDVDDGGGGVANEWTLKHWSPKWQQPMAKYLHS